MEKYIICSICKKEIGIAPGEPGMFDGFYDIDTKTFCCWDCRHEHYEKKQGDAEGVTYSEMPPTVGLIQRFTTIKIIEK
ncbi:MAG: hypothetical protein ACKVPJ_13590 [Chitinophagales bacterium]